MKSQPRRQPPGRPTGGQFAPNKKEPSSLDLTGAGDDPPSRGVAEMLERTVSSTITVDELNELSKHDKPVVVRAAIARTPYPGVAERCSYDPHPLVRALALEGWDLSEESRARLEADEDVQRLLQIIQADN